MSDPQELVEAPRKRFAEWLIEPMMRNRATYAKVALAALLINIFGLVSSLFSMTVYDRVLPNNAISSLVGLSIGLGLVIIFDFILRSLRAYFVDVAGVNVDREIGEKAFERLVAMPLNARRGSTGALAGTMRELETLRDFFTSATLTAMIDVPFILLTLAVIALIGGWVVAVPLAMVPLTIIAGVATFPAMDRLASEAMREGLNKQSVLVEAIGGIETVKSSGAGDLLGQRWLRTIDSYSDMATRQRLLANISTNVANAAQTISFAGVVIVGVLLVETRDLTLGGLIACSLLSSRAVAPLAQIAQLLSRITATRTAYSVLNPFMSEDPGLVTGLKPAVIEGTVEFRNVSFRYPGAKEDALDKLNLKINAGERIALLGRVGSGKSTIARLALGLYTATDGLVMVDGTDIRQMDLPTLRRHVGASLQESVLFTGSIRDNIALGRRQVDDEEMLRVARLTGVHDFIGRVANGYDLTLADRGESLSGGQRQSIALARALAGRPKFLVLDEPTSAMDSESENQLISRLEEETRGRTLLVITHRMPLLRLVDRVVIITDGKVAADGPRDEILRRITRPVAA
ncbi:MULTISPECIES: type I secretion system permease/ATPase [unclassified Sphingomonas]|jgi:ATP-binding cassette subfamily C protein LapB|uniref:type I secretion system permease/ATPase n=1 Tax=unclassified Sphingomonas TaxID=196159 RepID=UPI00082EE100|nr:MULTISPECIES: type I secretion system permease/ATPase [unclassified Sphingomonas]